MQKLKALCGSVAKFRNAAHWSSVLLDRASGCFLWKSWRSPQRVTRMDVSVSLEMPTKPMTEEVSLRLKC